MCRVVWLFLCLCYSSPTHYWRPRQKRVQFGHWDPVQPESIVSTVLIRNGIILVAFANIKVWGHPPPPLPWPTLFPNFASYFGMHISWMFVNVQVWVSEFLQILLGITSRIYLFPLCVRNKCLVWVRTVFLLRQGDTQASLIFFFDMWGWRGSNMSAGQCPVRREIKFWDLFQIAVISNKTHDT